jgi:GntR family transcriptional regulator, transcriptional repressor for pyruvate dehydrogenase complex
MNRLDFTPIKTKRLYEEVLEQFKRLITAGELKPGDKLLPERELAERLQVSRPSVREAIRTLEMMGVVEIRPGGGSFLRNTNTDDIIRPLAMFLAVGKNSMLEMFEVRRIFETAMASIAAERASEEDVSHIKQALNGMTDRFNAHDLHKGEQHDIEFHFGVAQATHNSLLIKLFRTITGEFSHAVAAARHRLYLDEEGLQRVIEQHQNIYKAIESRDPEVAANTMLAHLNYAEEEINKRMS